jgi:hypothetical protein
LVRGGDQSIEKNREKDSSKRDQRQPALSKYDGQYVA